MRKFLILAAALLAIPSFAQAEEKRKGEVFVTPQVTIPVGEFADAAGIGVGGTVGASYRLVPKLALTARAGYNYHFEVRYREDEFYQPSTAPILLGIQYEFGSKIYGLAEIGYVFTFTNSTLFGRSQSDRTGELGGNIGLGYDFGLAMVTAMLSTPNLTGSLDPHLGILVGVQVPLFSFNL